MENIIHSVELKSCKIELVEKTSKEGKVYMACMLVNENGRKQIGFGKDYFVIRKYLGGVNNG